MIWMLVGGILLVIWILFTFITPAGLGIVHLLLAAGVLCLVRGWVALDAVHAQ